MADKLHADLVPSDGIHSAEAFAAVADEAARGAVVQVAGDRGKHIYQTAGTAPGFYIALGVTGSWQYVGDVSAADAAAAAAALIAAHDADPAAHLTLLREAPRCINEQRAALVTAADGDPSCAIGLPYTPVGAVRVFVDGVLQVLGYGLTGADLFFSGDGGTTARAEGDIVATDVPYWNGSTAGFELDTADELSIVFDADLSNPFAGLYLRWQGGAGKELSGANVTDWTTNGGSADPLTLSLFGGSLVNGANYVEAVNPGFTTIGVSSEGDDTAFASVDADGYAAVCMKVQASGGAGTDVEGLWLYEPGNPDLPSVVLGYLDGSAFAMYMPIFDSLEFDLGSATVIAQLPVSVGDVPIIELWSDATNINARINGGAIGSVAWVGNRWPALFDGFSVASGSERDGAVTARICEAIVVRGAYEGDAVAAAWRAKCAQYGYGGA